MSGNRYPIPNRKLPRRNIRADLSNRSTPLVGGDLRELSTGEVARSGDVVGVAV
jgi:hypothetical protein